MSFNSKGEFPEQDRLLLELKSKSDWIPLEPSELISPFIPKEKTDDSDRDARLKKAQDVMHDYGKIIEQCEMIRYKLEGRSKDLSVPIKPTDSRVLEAASRLFRREVTEITFDMYKEAIERLSKISNDGVAKPGVDNGTT